MIGPLLPLPRESLFSCCSTYAAQEVKRGQACRGQMAKRLESNGFCGAGNGTRTRDPQLGKLMLYQLSYSRPQARIPQALRRR